MSFSSWQTTLDTMTLSCYGSREIDTPVLDQLAREGIRLTSFYAGCTICTPSRMALLTGMYPVRCGWQEESCRLWSPTSNGLSTQTTTIAEVYQRAGYTTALIGKWHLGDTAEHSPMAHGFDSAFSSTRVTIKPKNYGGVTPSLRTHSTIANSLSISPQKRSSLLKPIVISILSVHAFKCSTFSSSGASGVGKPRTKLGGLWRCR